MEKSRELTPSRQDQRGWPWGSLCGGVGVPGASWKEQRQKGLTPVGAKLRSWGAFGDISSPGHLRRGHALLHRQHPGLPGARRCSLWSGRCGMETHATIGLLPYCCVLPGTGKDPSGWQHGSIPGTSSPVTPSHSAATRGRDILTDATPLQMSPNPLYGAAGCLLPPPAPPPPCGPPPADPKGG